MDVPTLSKTEPILSTFLEISLIPIAIVYLKQGRIRDHCDKCRIPQNLPRNIRRMVSGTPWFWIFLAEDLHTVTPSFLRLKIVHTGMGYLLRACHTTTSTAFRASSQIDLLG